MGGATEILRFGEYELDFGRHELRRAGAPVVLQPTPLRVLLHLAEHRDRTVPRRELLDAVWPGVVVGDEALTTALAEVRRAVGDHGDTQQVIRTQKGAGYRFVAEVAAVAPSEATSPAQPGLRTFTATLRRRWLALGAAGLAIAALAAAFVLHERAVSAPAKAAPLHMLAVIPFRNVSGDSALDPLADGLTAEISEGLRPAILVPTTTMLAFKGKNVDVRDLQRTLGATHVLQGTVQAASDKVRVTIQLRETTGAHLSWSETYEQPRRDLLAVQTAITSRVAGVVPFLLPFTATQDPDLAPVDHAIDFSIGLVWTGQLTMRQGETALSLLEGVLARDPDNLRAHASLANIWVHLANSEKRNQEKAIAKMKWHASEARRIAPGSEDAHAATALVFIVERNWAAAEREARAACDLSTSRMALGCYWLRSVLLWTGRAREASEITRGQLDVFPNSAVCHANLGFELQAQGNYADAERAFTRAEQIEPAFSLNDSGARWLAGYPDDWVVDLRLLFVQLGDQAAVAEVDRIHEAEGPRGVAHWAADHADRLDPLAPRSVHEVVAAVLYSQAGEEESAVAALESSASLSTFPPYLESPIFDGFRDHPRFQAIVESQGLTAYHAKYLRREPNASSASTP